MTFQLNCTQIISYFISLISSSKSHLESKSLTKLKFKRITIFLTAYHLLTNSDVGWFQYEVNQSSQ